MSENIIVLLEKPDGMVALQQFSYLVLPHPRNGPCVFLCHEGNIFELQRIELRQLGCMMMGQRISPGNLIYLATLIDPRFILLPFLETSAGRFCPLDQIIPFVQGCDRIPLSKAGLWKLNEVCDVNDKLGDDMILYKYNEEKTVAWLKKKLMKTAQLLCRKRLSNSVKQNNGIADTFNISSRSKSSETESKIQINIGNKYSHLIFNQYLWIIYFPLFCSF